MALGVDGQLVASGGTDGTVRLWEPDAGRPLQILGGHTGAVSGVALSADGHLLANTDEDGTVRLRDAGSGQRGSAPCKFAVYPGESVS